MTIDLGFGWTRLPAEIAFVDVPEHERFVPNMLAGVGPVPAVMMVVAADEGWRAQSEGASGGDRRARRPARAARRDPQPPGRPGTPRAEARTRGLLARRRRGRDGQRHHRQGPGRAARRPRPARRRVARARPGHRRTVVGGPRVHDPRPGHRRDGHARRRPHQRGRRTPARRPRPRRAGTLHVGSAAVPVRLRPLGDDTARLPLTTPLPLRIGDSALPRDLGRHRVVAGVTVLDVRPPRLATAGVVPARPAADERPPSTNQRHRYGCRSTLV